MDITNILPELRKVFLNELELLIVKHNQETTKGELIKQAVELLKQVVNNEKQLTLDNVQEVSRLLECHNEQFVENYMWYQLNTADKVFIEEIERIPRRTRYQWLLYKK